MIIINDNNNNNNDNNINNNNNEILRKGYCVKKLTGHMAKVPFEGGEGAGSLSRSGLIIL